MKWMLSVAALVALTSAMPAAAQPYGFGDDGRPFRRGPGWDGPDRAPPWARWHHRRWRDERFGGPGWRDGDRRREGERFGRDGGFRGRDRFETDEGGRGFRGGPGRDGGFRRDVDRDDGEGN